MFRIFKRLDDIESKINNLCAFKSSIQFYCKHKYRVAVSLNGYYKFCTECDYREFISEKDYLSLEHKQKTHDSILFLKSNGYKVAKVMNAKDKNK